MSLRGTAHTVPRSVAGGRPAPAQTAPRWSSLDLGALPTAVACARLHVRQILWEWKLSADADTSELLVSELVTNGLKAVWATGLNLPISLNLSANRELLVIELWDGNPRPPVLLVPDDDVPSLDEEAGAVFSSSEL
jgi:hypothetical protein